METIEAIYAKGGAEDLLLDATSPPTVDQTRGTGVVAISKVNANTIPVVGKKGSVDFKSIKDFLDTLSATATTLVKGLVKIGTPAQLSSGTDTDPRAYSPKTIHDYVIGVLSTIPSTATETVEGLVKTGDYTTLENVADTTPRAYSPEDISIYINNKLPAAQTGSYGFVRAGLIGMLEDGTDNTYYRAFTARDISTYVTDNLPSGADTNVLGLVKSGQEATLNTGTDIEYRAFTAQGIYNHVTSRLPVTATTTTEGIVTAGTLDQIKTGDTVPRGFTGVALRDYFNYRVASDYENGIVRSGTRAMLDDGTDTAHRAFSAKDIKDLVLSLV